MLPVKLKFECPSVVGGIKKKNGISSRKDGEAREKGLTLRLCRKGSFWERFENLEFLVQTWTLSAQPLAKIDFEYIFGIPQKKFLNILTQRHGGTEKNDFGSTQINQAI